MNQTKLKKQAEHTEQCAHMTAQPNTSTNTNNHLTIEIYFFWRRSVEETGKPMALDHT